MYLIDIITKMIKLTTNNNKETTMKKENKKPNMLKALKIKVMTLNDDKKLENNFANQLNDYLIKKNKQNYFKV